MGLNTMCEHALPSAHAAVAVSNGDQFRVEWDVVPACISRKIGAQCRRRGRCESFMVFMKDRLEIGRFSVVAAGDLRIPLILRRKPSMPKIKFIKENKTIEVEAGSNLRKVARSNGCEVYPGIHKYPLMNCMGFSMCGKCVVNIKKGMENCSPMGFREALRLKPSFMFIGHENEMRLSCQLNVNGDIEVETQPELNWHGERFWG